MQHNASMGRAARLPGAAKQAALVVPGCFQKTAGVALKQKKKKRHTEVRCLTELTQAHRGNTDPCVSEGNGKHSAFY